MAAKNSNPQPPAPRPSSLTPEQVERVLSVQERDLQIKSEQIALENKREANFQELAKATLEAQLKDRQAQREHLERQQKSRLLVFALALGLVIGLCIYALFCGKDGVALEVIKLLAAFAGGWGVGHGFRDNTPRAGSKSSND